MASLGAGAAPLNPAYAQSEFAFYLEDLRPRLLVLPRGDLAPARAAAGDDVPVADLVIRPGQAPLLEGTAREPASTAAAAPDDVALLLHTSGTTSRPKQVPLSHRNLLASARSIVRHYALGPDDVSYCAMPLFHVHGIVASTLAPLVSGGTVVAPRRVAPSRFWPALGEARRHLVQRQPDVPRDAARRRARRGAGRRAGCASSAPAAPRSGPPSPTAWRSTSACRCWRPTA